jgi:hypothetical protein
MMFEEALYDHGMGISSKEFFGEKVSAYSKGCMNLQVPQFHVLREVRGSLHVY